MQQLLEAARSLDTGAVARILREMIGERGVADVWERVCAPALRGISGSHDGFDVAVEHVLSEGVRLALDMVSDPRHADIRTNHVLLACAPGEAHALPLHALSACLYEHRVGSWLLGARVPWPSLTTAITQVHPDTVVVWAQSATTADVDGLTALTRRHPGTRIAAAGPGWSALPAGVPHLTSLDLAVWVCAQEPVRIGTER